MSATNWKHIIIYFFNIFFHQVKLAKLHTVKFTSPSYSHNSPFSESFWPFLNDFTPKSILLAKKVRDKSFKLFINILFFFTSFTLSIKFILSSWISQWLTDDWLFIDTNLSFCFNHITFFCNYLNLWSLLVYRSCFVDISSPFFKCITHFIKLGHFLRCTVYNVYPVFNNFLHRVLCPKPFLVIRSVEKLTIITSIRIDLV